MNMLEELEKLPGFDNSFRGGSIFELCSSGDRKTAADNLPALFLSEEIAEQALVLAVSATVFGKTWSWVRKPKTERYQMTEAEARNMTQRLVSDRYGSHCSIEVSDA